MIKHVLAQSLTLPWEGEGQPNISGPTGFHFTDTTNVIGQLFSKPVINQQPITRLVFAAAGIGLLLMLISAGFSFLTSAGDAKKLESGKQRFTYAIVGFIIIFAAYWIVQMLGKIFGIGGIQESFN